MKERVSCTDQFFSIRHLPFSIHSMISLLREAQIMLRKYTLMQGIMNEIWSCWWPGASSTWSSAASNLILDLHHHNIPMLTLDLAAIWGSHKQRLISQRAPSSNMMYRPNGLYDISVSIWAQLWAYTSSKYHMSAFDLWSQLGTSNYSICLPN